MSFSSQLKDELGAVSDNARHCRLAELAAVLCFSGQIRKEGENWRLSISVENPNTANAGALLMKKLFQAGPLVREQRSARNLTSYTLELEGLPAKEAAEALKVSGSGPVFLPDILRLTQKNCCKRAFLRGAFLSVGSISDPDRYYHFEIPCKNPQLAAELVRLMAELHLDARTVERQNYSVVYVKESEQIADLLGLMGARRGLLELENARIRRGVRGSVNRRVNCETANINKTAQASARQIEDIRLIQERIGLSSLPNGLDEMARVRLQYPEANLSELGSYLEPPVGKSGVNHRLRKLASIAASLKNQGGELL